MGVGSMAHKVLSSKLVSAGRKGGREGGREERKEASVLFTCRCPGSCHLERSSRLKSIVIPSSLPPPDSSGSTAVICLVTPSLVACANLGDSRAVLLARKGGRYRGREGGEGGREGRREGGSQHTCWKSTDTYRGDAPSFASSSPSLPPSLHPPLPPSPPSPHVFIYPATTTMTILPLLSPCMPCPSPSTTNPSWRARNSGWRPREG